MSPGTPLRRDRQPVGPIRHVHLGLGNFFRAHQAYYTAHAPDADEWGIAAFTGRSAALAQALNAQDGLYTLDTRSADGDGFEIIRSLHQAHSAAEHDEWLRYLASSETRLLTLTVTEAGYLRNRAGGLDLDDATVRHDLQLLSSDKTTAVRTVAGRLVAGLYARRAADAGPLTVISCDNLPANAAIARRIVDDLAAALDPTLPGWIEESTTFVATVVDRITPRTTPADIDLVAARTGLVDAAPVVTEPFSEWILSGQFAAGHPQWEEAGARFVEDLAPFEQRKLWLLNGGHSLLAYAGSLRGHRTVADAVADPTCRGWLHEWWTVAAPHLELTATEIADYQAALLRRFDNQRIRHLLAQIAADGSQKLPVRVLPVLRAERAARRLPTGAIRIVAAWICHLRGAGEPVDDARASELTARAAGPLRPAVQRVLATLDPVLGADDDLVAAILEIARELSPN